MASKIEEIIEEIEDYIDTCKPAMLSSDKIVVNRQDLDTLLEELKSTTPDEIKRYQRIINNKDMGLGCYEAYLVVLDALK